MHTLIDSFLELAGENLLTNNLQINIKYKIQLKLGYLMKRVLYFEDKDKFDTWTLCIK